MWPILERLDRIEARLSTVTYRSGAPIEVVIPRLNVGIQYTAVGKVYDQNDQIWTVTFEYDPDSIIPDAIEFPVIITHVVVNETGSDTGVESNVGVRQPGTIFLLNRFFDQNGTAVYPWNVVFKVQTNEALGTPRPP